MIRKIIRIDVAKCTGCGLCAKACHEGAIEMADGKARLAREHFCDGFGDCLPACPAGAITFEEREAPAYDEAAVLAAKAQNVPAQPACPGSRIHAMLPAASCAEDAVPSQLRNWPPQIKLAPLTAPYFQDASLLIAADCTAYACADIHRAYMAGKVTLIGCPKLDGIDYSEKLTQILRANAIADVTVLRMEVPCCGGLERAVRMAIARSGKQLPCSVVTIGIDGCFLRDGDKQES